ncbi:MAG: hypothetical protein Ct9H300mP1_13800 [Planctomycetaceae bacterium]|nr:MAG: hypothetical protein Ct9H300mP1_13800 [Planctomycetaceae bacterium]
MLDFEVPAVLLLALPLGWVFWQWFRVRGVTGWLRLTLLGLRVLALSGPRSTSEGRGRRGGHRRPVAVGVAEESVRITGPGS